MKDIVWGNILSIGVDEIDEDHRKLIDIFNTLNHALTDNESPAYLAAVLEELINCTVWHFSHEERLMLKHGYDKMDEHKEIHQNLIASAKDLQGKILKGDSAIGGDEIEFLEHWLTGHIFSDDMKLGDYLSKVM